MFKQLISFIGNFVICLLIPIMTSFILLGMMIWLTCISIYSAFMFETPEKLTQRIKAITKQDKDNQL